jgi:hypothetical protein
MRPIKPPHPGYSGTTAQWESLTSNQRYMQRPSSIEKTLQYRATHKNEKKVLDKAWAVKNVEKLKASSKVYQINHKNNIASRKRAKLCKDGRDWLVANGGVLTEDLAE